MESKITKHKCDLLLIPSTLGELNKFLETHKEANYIILSGNLSIISFCIKKNIRLIQYKELIDPKKYKKIDITGFMKNFAKENSELFSNKLQHKYFFFFQSFISDILKISSFSELLGDGISKKIDFKRLHLFSYDHSSPGPRKNLESLNKLLLSIRFKDFLYKDFYKKGLKTVLIHSFHKYLNKCSGIIFFVEYLFYKIRFFSFQNIRLKEKKDSIIFFSDGRDFTFHSILSFRIENSHCFKGSSIFNKETKNDFCSVSNLKFYLLNGFFSKNLECVSNINQSFLKKVFKEYGIPSEYINYYGEANINNLEFWIKRDFSFIRSISHMIKKINPKLIFSSTLTLTSLGAFDQGVKSVSEFEGFGIDHNPSSSSLSGDYIFSPTIFSNNMFKKHNMGDGVLINTGAYYLRLEEFNE